MLVVVALFESGPVRILCLKWQFSQEIGICMAYLSVIMVGWSSAKSSGAGTNILTILGADNKLDFVAPKERKKCWTFPAFEQKQFFQAHIQPVCLLNKFVQLIKMISMLCADLRILKAMGYLFLKKEFKG